MAENTIGIRIQLNGMNTVISDIQTFEQLLKEAKEDLKQIPVGEQNFKKLAKEISVAETQLNNLNQSFKGVTGERATEGFSKLGAGIASSFAAATAAVGLFGTETEEVSKAAAQAQNLLTLALSIRGVMEIKTGAAIAAKVIAEKANAAATVATTTATRTLYTTVAANPYGAILTVLGLLVSAYLAFGNEQEEVAEKTKTYNELLLDNQIATVNTTARIKTYNSILQDTNSSLEEQAGAYSELQKLVPILSNYTLEQARAQGVLNEAITDELKLIDLRTEQKALEEFLLQKKKEQIKADNERINAAIRAAQADAIAEQRRVTYATNSAEEGRKAYDAVIARAVAGAGVLSNEQKLQNVTKEIAAIEGKRVIQVDKFKQSQKEVTKETEAQKKNAFELQLNYEKTVQYLTELANQYKKFAQEAQVDRTPPLIVNTLKGLTDARKALADPSLTKIFKELGIEIREFNGGLEITGDVLTKVSDEFGKYYEDTRNILAAQATDTRYTFEQFTKTVNTLLDEVSLRFQKGEITKDAFDAFQQLGQQYLEFGKLVRDNPPFEGDNLKEFLDLEKQILIATGLYTKEFDDVNGTVVDVKGNVISLTSALQRQDDLLVDFRAKYESQLVQELDAQKLLGDGYKEQVKILVERGKITKEQGEKFLSAEDTKKRNDELIKLIDELTKARIDALKSTTRFIVEQETVIREFYGEALKASKEGLALQGDAIKNTLLNNLELVVSLTQKENKIVIDEKKLQNEQLLKLEEDLMMKGIDISKFTEEEKLKILRAYLAKQKEEKDKAADEDKKRNKITADDIVKTLQQVNALVGRLASLTSQYFELQIKKLDASYKEALTNVVGDTEEANQKRLELESQYQKQKAELEKRATIKSLQFQLIQAIIDTAQAVTANLEIPPLAIAVGVLGAAQIELIREQLALAQSLASGGKIKMGAGGMFMGPSHEYGGIMLGAMGLNVEGGEALINRTSSLNYGGLISSINQMGGGQPIVNNPSGSLQEERLLQILAKDRQVPMRAYVLSSEITNSQAINRRLDELATL